MPKFIVDDQVFGLDELLQANDHDPDACAWLRMARPGDVLPGAVGGVAAVCIPEDISIGA